jgi:demethylmenaquinone methyltransferase/2-methoxy-6-polyprenyl-1,4-benzoquinol methylase
MFNRIAPWYDFLNHFLSFGLDHGWRQQAIAELDDSSDAPILDVAAGTGDMAIKLRIRYPKSQIVLTDISTGMLKIAAKRVDNNQVIVLSEATLAPFLSQQFQIITVAFGLRNFSQPHEFLVEAMRLLRPGGQLLILEFGEMNDSLPAYLLKFILRRIVPKVGGLVSGNIASYQYLMDSMERFSKEFNVEKAILQRGFKITSKKAWFFGLVRSVIARKT